MLSWERSFQIPNATITNSATIAINIETILLKSITLFFSGDSSSLTHCTGVIRPMGSPLSSRKGYFPYPVPFLSSLSKQTVSLYYIFATSSLSYANCLCAILSRNIPRGFLSTIKSPLKSGCNTMNPNFYHTFRRPRPTPRSTAVLTLTWKWSATAFVFTTSAFVFLAPPLCIPPWASKRPS